MFSSVIWVKFLVVQLQLSQFNASRIMLVARIAINFLKALKMNMKAMRVANNSSVNLKKGDT